MKSTIDVPVYTINKNVVTSLQDKIDVIDKSATYKYIYNSLCLTDDLIESINAFLHKRDPQYIRKYKKLIYLGKYSDFDSCDIFIIVNNHEYDYRYFTFVYIVDGFSNHVNVSINLGGAITIYEYGNQESLLNGFIDLCTLFVEDYISYDNRNHLSSFMYLYRDIEYVEHQPDEDIEENTCSNIEIPTCDNDAEWRLLATVKNGRYHLIGRFWRNAMKIVCNCPAHFFRTKYDDECEHIQKFLRLSDEVPPGELIPEEYDATVDGKEFVVKYRIDNEFRIFKV